MDLFKAAFAGCFYALTEVPLGLNLVKRAAPYVLQGSHGKARWRAGWSDPDGGGDLAEATSPDGSCWEVEGGLARLWLRLDERHLPKPVLDRALQKGALRRFGVPFKRLPRPEQEAFEEEVAGPLRERAFVRTRIVPGLLREDGLLWMGRVPAGAGALVCGSIGRALGEARVDPLVWDADDLRWFGSSTAVLMELRRGTTELSRAVRIDELLLKGRGFRLRTSADADRHLPMLQALLEVDGLPEVVQVGFSVTMNGEVTSLRMTPSGVTWALPPPSGGGLFAERVGRRLDDVTTAAELCREALEVAIERVEKRGEV